MYTNKKAGIRKDLHLKNNKNHQFDNETWIPRFLAIHEVYNHNHRERLFDTKAKYSGTHSSRAKPINFKMQQTFV